ncbi:hypothetical protein ACQ1Z3_15550, partial [Enterococcus faecalis]
SPIYHANQLEILICGEEGFSRTGVMQDATRAYAFWSLAAEMGSADAQAYLGERLNASRDNPAREIWGNKTLAYKLMECAHAQEN